MACRFDADERAALLEVERVARMAVRYEGAGNGVARAGGPLDVVLMRLDDVRLEGPPCGCPRIVGGTVGRGPDKGKPAPATVFHKPGCAHAR